MIGFSKKQQRAAKCLPPVRLILYVFFLLLSLFSRAHVPVKLPCFYPACHSYGRRQREPDTGWLSLCSLFSQLQTRLWKTRKHRSEESNKTVHLKHIWTHLWMVYISIFKRQNTQEQVAKHTFITPVNIEPMQCIQSHRSKQKAGVEDTGCVSFVAFGEEWRRMG